MSNARQCLQIFLKAAEPCTKFVVQYFKAKELKSSLLAPLLAGSTAGTETWRRYERSEESWAEITNVSNSWEFYEVRSDTFWLYP